MAKVLIGVTGSISAYKSVSLLRLLQIDGHDVRVIMTESAAKFIGTITFQSLTSHKTYLKDFDPEAPLAHIELAKWADLFIIAPASGNTIAKMAAGIADNLLTSTILAASCPIVLCPAMNNKMYLNIATQANLKTLKERNVIIIEPATGNLACGDVAIGKLEEPELIFQRVRPILNTNKFAAKLHIMITAGPTSEALDPVRMITNRSSGKMGYAIAEQAVLAGANVTLITGKVDSSLNTIQAMVTHCIKAESAEDMHTVVSQNISKCDILIMAAAVADYTPTSQAPQKIKKEAGALTLTLIKTKDILKSVSVNKTDKQIFVGFAAESENLHEHALKKLNEKNLDIIVANDISRKDIGFDSDNNEVDIYDNNGNITHIEKRAKKDIALLILQEAISKFRTLNV